VVGAEAAPSGPPEFTSTEHDALVTETPPRPPARSSRVDPVLLDEPPNYPEGLTPKGRAAYRKVHGESAHRFDQRLRQELGRDWLQLGIGGPAEFTEDRVLAAAETVTWADRRTIIGEVEAENATEQVRGRQAAETSRRRQARRATLLWRTGAALSTACTVGVTTIDPAGTGIWPKAVLVLGAAVGVFITRPQNR
jgi:hypothetical protein